MMTDTSSVDSSSERVLSVSALNRLARQTLEQNFPLLWVAGEISNLTQATSGHIYFSLKDQEAQVRCVMFRNRAQLLPWRLANGTQVEARVLVSLYEARGDFQLNVETLRRAGLGALFEAFERLRARLLAAGWFANERKRPLPRYPRRIGIISSMQAAALRDVLTALQRRASHLPVTIYPAPVQGEGAAAQIAQAIAAANRHGECDVLIVARGGGSIEDLWAFNEEIVAQAIHDSALPVVAGIGHETDVTIADYIADQRAATPTAAAELVSAGYFEAAKELTRISRQFNVAMWRMHQERAQRLDQLAYRLINPAERLARGRLQAVHLQTRLAAAQRRALETAGAKVHNLLPRLSAATAAMLRKQGTALEALGLNLTHLNPDAILQRGFSIARDPQGKIIYSSAQIAIGAGLRLQFGQGWADSRVTDKGNS